MPVVTLSDLLESGVHFGHQTRRWNPKMDEYIFTSRNGVHIIDLVQTANLLEDAYQYVRGAAESGKSFLFVGTKRQAAGIVAQEASRCGSYYVNQRWLGGMLTNWTTIKTRVERLKDLERMQSSGALDLRPKKEASMLRRELDKLQKYLGGIKTMRRIPDAVIIVDVRREYNAVQECQKLGLPIISLLDTNCDPDVVDVPIPANDDAIRAIKLVVGRLADAIYEGSRGGGTASGSGGSAAHAADIYDGYDGADYDDEGAEIEPSDSAASNVVSDSVPTDSVPTDSAPAADS
ncbi:MAG: 30S ribosomal protein S2 [Phormidesmis sp.]